MNLEAEKIIKLYVQCERDLEVRDDGSGFLRVIPIIGGHFEGVINGIVMAGGADWNTTKENKIAHVFAKYLLKTEDGEYIAIENEGKIDYNEEARMIKTVPTFQVDHNSKYAWLNSGVYVGQLESGEKEWQVEITIYKLK